MPCIYTVVEEHHVCVLSSHNGFPIFIVKFKGKPPSVGKPDGNATFWDGKKKFDRVKLKRGKATVRLRDLVAGKHTLKVTYPGNKSWKKSKATTAFKAK